MAWCVLVCYPYEEFGVSHNLASIFLCKGGVGGPSISISFFSLVTEFKLYFSVNDSGYKETFCSLRHFSAKCDHDVQTKQSHEGRVRFWKVVNSLANVPI